MEKSTSFSDQPTNPLLLPPCPRYSFLPLHLFFQFLLLQPQFGKHQKGGKCSERNGWKGGWKGRDHIWFLIGGSWDDGTGGGKVNVGSELEEKVESVERENPTTAD